MPSWARALTLEITNGDLTIVIDFTGFIGQTIDAKTYLVLYENGTWTMYQEDGSQKRGEVSVHGAPAYSFASPPASKNRDVAMLPLAT